MADDKNVEQTTAADVTPAAGQDGGGHTTWDDVPSSHESCGDDPAAEVAATFPDPPEADADVPSSHDTSGNDPAAEVAATRDDTPRTAD